MWESSSWTRMAPQNVSQSSRILAISSVQPSCKAPPKRKRSITCSMMVRRRAPEMARATALSNSLNKEHHEVGHGSGRPGGFKPWAFRIAWTPDGAVPAASAIVRRRRWVASRGVRVTVFSSARSTTATASGGLARWPYLVAAQAVYSDLLVLKVARHVARTAGAWELQPRGQVPSNGAEVLCEPAGGPALGPGRNWRSCQHRRRTRIRPPPDAT